MAGSFAAAMGKGQGSKTPNANTQGAKGPGGKAPGSKTQGAKSQAKSAKRSSTLADGAKPRSQRQLRVAEEIRHLLSTCFLRAQFRDPDLDGVQITVGEVRVSPDLKYATAFVSLLGRNDIEAKLPALARAAPYFRHLLAEGMRLRTAPSVSFQADTSVQYAAHIDELLHRPDVARDLD